MPYPRYGQTDRRGDHRRDDVSPWQTGNYPNTRIGGVGASGLLPTPNRGSGAGSADMGQLALAGNLLGSLLTAGGGANLASSLAMLQGATGASGMGMGGLAFGSSSGSVRSMMDSRGSGRDVRSRGGRDRSPARKHYRARSRSRSPRRNRSGNDERSRKSYKRSRDSPSRERAPHEIYIGNYPVRFREHDVRKLFEEHGVKVTTIRLKHDGLKVFAFAETVSQEEVQKAVKAMDSNEINGRRLRVRSAADKDKKTPSAPPSLKKPRRELVVEDVTRHLAFAFVGFLERQGEKEGTDESKLIEIKQAKDLITSIFDLPPQSDDDSLKVSRDLELIFMQNNRREIKVPMDEDDSSKKSLDKKDDPEHSDEDAAAVEQMEDDDGNWKRGKVKHDDEDDDEEGNGEGSEGEGVEEDGLSNQAEGTELIVDECGGSDAPEEAAEEEEKEKVKEEEAADEDEELGQAAEAETEPDVKIEPEVPEIEEEAFPKPVLPNRGRGRGRRGRGRKA